MPSPAARRLTDVHPARAPSALRARGALSPPCGRRPGPSSAAGLERKRSRTQPGRLAQEAAPRARPEAQDAQGAPPARARRDPSSGAAPRAPRESQAPAASLRPAGGPAAGVRARVPG